MGKTHPDTLHTIEGMAIVYNNTENFTNAEELFRLALDGLEKSLGKVHKDTWTCANCLRKVLFHLGN